MKKRKKGKEKNNKTNTKLTIDNARSSLYLYKSLQREINIPFLDTEKRRGNCTVSVWLCSLRRGVVRISIALNLDIVI